MDSETRCDPVENHEQFLQRVSKFFPVDSSLAWSRLERAVFNNLMSKLIFRYGYAEISDEMLQTTLEQMQAIVRRSSRADTAWYTPDEPRFRPDGRVPVERTGGLSSLNSLTSLDAR